MVQRVVGTGNRYYAAQAKVQRLREPIVVLGSSNTDMIIKVPRIPKPGETVLGGAFSTAAGGKGANQAVAAARAGGDVTFIARIGTDMFGERAVKGFIADGINIEHVVRDGDVPSGVALIFVGAAGENSIAVASGCNSRLMTSDVTAAKDAIVSAGILLMQLEVPIGTVRAAAELASGSGVPVILNPAPAQPLGDDLLGHITILTPNEHEVLRLTGVAVTDEASAQAAADALMARGVDTVLITLGARGAYVANADYRGIVPSFTVEAVDTTAAGDVFNGVLAASLADGGPLIDAVRFACGAAALSVTKLGAQTSTPIRDDIASFLAQHGA